MKSTHSARSRSIAARNARALPTRLSRTARYAPGQRGYEEKLVNAGDTVGIFRAG